MNIIGSIFTCDIINLNFNCFKSNDKSVKHNKLIQTASKNLTLIHILPIQPNIKITKLPIGNCIKSLSTIIVGQDNVFISLKLKGDLINYINEEQVLNKTGVNILDNELNKLFENIISSTKYNKHIQLFFTLNNILYFLNTYQLIEDDLVGIIIFIRPYSSI